MPLARYAEVISGFATWLQAWEPRVRDALPEHLRPWFDERRRARFAREDLAWLRATHGLAPCLDGEGPALAVPLGDLAQALGSLYVIEGSTLGARVIAPRLEASLGVVAGHGARYFNGFGDDAISVWRDFRECAERELGGAVEPTDSACQSARRTFASLIELFTPLEGL
jgi:heme oxygenase